MKQPKDWSLKEMRKQMPKDTAKELDRVVKELGVKPRKKIKEIYIEDKVLQAFFMEFIVTFFGGKPENVYGSFNKLGAYWQQQTMHLYN